MNTLRSQPNTSTGAQRSGASLWPAARTGGFSLLEVIVSTALLAVIVSGVMSLIYQTTTSGRYQKDRIIATYLAAEAIEFVRADRDSHFLENRANEMPGWKTDADGKDHIFNDCNNGDTCQLDARMGEEKWGTCSDFDSCRLRKIPDGDGGFLYGYGTAAGEDSRFSRTVELTEPSGDPGVKVVAEVTWERPGGETSSVSVSEYLYDYRR